MEQLRMMAALRGKDCRRKGFRSPSRGESGKLLANPLEKCPGVQHLDGARLRRRGLRVVRDQVRAIDGAGGDKVEQIFRVDLLVVKLHLIGQG